MNWSDLEVAELEEHQVTNCPMKDHHIILVMNREKTSTLRTDKYEWGLGQVLRMELEKKNAYIYAVVHGIDTVTVPEDLDKQLLDREGNYESVEEFMEELENLGYSRDKFPREMNQYDIAMVDAIKAEKDPWRGEIA